MAEDDGAVVMILRADVYSVTDDTPLGSVYSLKEASFTEALDEVGSIGCSLPVADREGFELLASEREIRLQLEHDDTVRELGRGVIRERTISDIADLKISGPDATIEVKKRNTLLGRTYANVSLQSIADDLIGLVPGWSITVQTAYANLLHSARFEGVNVFKALMRLAEERGLHIRQSTAAQTLEIGPFGQDCGIEAIAPSSLGIDVYLNDNLIIIDKLTQKTSTAEVINWIVPLGAGEGTAALTLKHSTRSIALGYPYDIQTMAGPDGRILYYLSDSTSIAAYGQSEKVVTFKEVGPIANSSTANTLAANALYDAAVAWLQRNSVPLVTYKMSAKKVRETIRAGDKIRITYKGVIETVQGDFVPIDLNYQLFWVMRKRENVGSDASTLDLDIASVDRYEMDTNRVIVGALESIRVKNVAVQTYVYTVHDTSERVIQGNGSGTPPNYKEAKFSLRFPRNMVDVVSVYIQIVTRPLYTHTLSDILFGSSQHYYYYSVYESDDYPCDLEIIINGVNRTSALGGAWNPSGGNSPVDVTLDISEYIIDDPGGLFQNHSIVIKAGHKTSEARVNTSYTSIIQGTSHGIIEGKLMVQGIAQGVVPSIA
jgi:hypothetical protein